jgi:hypothetical protein
MMHVALTAKTALPGKERGIGNFDEPFGIPRPCGDRSKK